uniref:Uncharacterized protein n=1 Tax=Arundo donax TaxID=35708 RepID=A0A0A9E2L3_ARUDO
MICLHGIPIDSSNLQVQLATMLSVLRSKPATSMAYNL